MKEENEVIQLEVKGDQELYYSQSYEKDHQRLSFSAFLAGHTLAEYFLPPQKWISIVSSNLFGGTLLGSLK